MIKKCYIKNIAQISLAFLCVTIIVSCGGSDPKDTEQTVAGSISGSPSVSAIELKSDRLSSSIKIPGELVAFQQVELYAKVNSFIKKLYVDVGSIVREGQLLATLEAPEITSQEHGAASRLKAQEALYLASKATYDRLLETSKTPGTVSQNDLDMALAKKNADLAQWESVKAAQEEVHDLQNYLTIRAPFSGVITARNVSAGAYVGPSGKGSDAPLFVLKEQQKLRLVVSIPEHYTSFVSTGTEVTFYSKSVSGKTFNGKISRISGALDDRLRSQQAEIDVINTDGLLLPGMIAEVTIALTGKEIGFNIPQSAVLNSTQGIFVIKAVDGKAVWTPIKTGNSMDEKMEVFGDIQEGDTLLKIADEEIRDGSLLGELEIEVTQN